MCVCVCVCVPVVTATPKKHTCFFFGGGVGLLEIGFLQDEHLEGIANRSCETNEQPGCVRDLAGFLMLE